MKKILAIILMLSMLFAMTSCALMNRLMGGTQKNPVSDTNDETNGGWKEGEVYVISTADELYQFAEDYNANRLPAQIAVRLDADIRVNDIADTYMNLTADHLGGYRMWTPIQYFKGTFDGNGHTVSGLVCCMDADEDGVIVWPSAFVGFLYEGAVIENLTIEESYFTTNNGNYVSSFCGRNSGTIRNCINRAKLGITTTTAGGIAAANEGEIRNCKNYADLQNIDDNCTKGLGGITGYNVTDYEGESTALVIGCVNYGKIIGVGTTGGIVGYSRGFIEDCINKGDVIGQDAGGIAGSSSSNGDKEIGNIQRCINYGNVHGSGYAAGITASSSFGEEHERNYGIYYSTNCGRVTGECAAGICAYMSYSKILECANFGDVDAVADGSSWTIEAAGICLRDSEDSLIQYSFNAGSVKATGGTTAASGICNSISGEVYCCYSIGDIISANGGAYGLAKEVREGGCIRACYFAGRSVSGNDQSSRTVGDLVFLDRDEHVVLCKAVMQGDDASIINPSWYSAFEYDGTWQMDPSAAYPYPTLRNSPVDFTE